MQLATLQDIAYNYIREGILTGKWRPGERLREDFIAHEIGISRTPVREAINRLAAHGLLKNTRRVGIYVADLDDTDALELLDVREYLEYLAVTRVAEREPAVPLEALQANQESFGKAVEDGRWENAMQYDREFHQLIMSMTGNKRLLAIYQEATAHIQLTQALNCQALDDLRKAVAEHALILAALVARDPEAVHQAVAGHFRRIRHMLQQRTSQADKTSGDPAIAKGA